MVKINKLCYLFCFAILAISTAQEVVFSDLLTSFSGWISYSSLFNMEAGASTSMCDGDTFLNQGKTNYARKTVNFTQNYTKLEFKFKTWAYDLDYFSTSRIKLYLNNVNVFEGDAKGVMKTDTCGSIFDDYYQEYSVKYTFSSAISQVEIKFVASGANTMGVFDLQVSTIVDPPPAAPKKSSKVNVAAIVVPIVCVPVIIFLCYFLVKKDVFSKCMEDLKRQRRLMKEHAKREREKEEVEERRKEQEEEEKKKRKEREEEEKKKLKHLEEEKNRLQKLKEKEEEIAELKRHLEHKKTQNSEKITSEQISNEAKIQQQLEMMAQFQAQIQAMQNQMTQMNQMNQTNQASELQRQLFELQNQIQADYATQIAYYDPNYPNNIGYQQNANYPQGYMIQGFPQGQMYNYQYAPQNPNQNMESVQVIVQTPQ